MEVCVNLLYPLIFLGHTAKYVCRCKINCVDCCYAYVMHVRIISFFLQVILEIEPGKMMHSPSIAAH